jgi:hypothetical protein
MTPFKDPHTKFRMKPLGFASGHGCHMNAFVLWGMAVTHGRYKRVTVPLPSGANIAKPGSCTGNTHACTSRAVGAPRPRAQQS